MKTSSISLRATLLAVLSLACGCGLETKLEEFAQQAGQQKTQTPAQVTGDAVSVASFNIQVFGTSKAGKPQVMDVLAQVVRKFDVVAIQEIRAKDQNLLPEFVRLVNSNGSQYDFVLGPRLGRTSSKEQYAFIYNTASIQLDRDCVYTVPDPQDYLHREPLVARFQVRTANPQDAFSFTLINIHTDPDETDQELDALDDVFRYVQNDGHGEDDVILLGDLNVDEYHLGQLGQLPNIHYAVSGVPTNTRGNKTYDNLVFDARSTSEYTGQWGVLSLQREFRLTEEQALEVSDHLPVWATFSIRESGSAGAVASRPGAQSR